MRLKRNGRQRFVQTIHNFRTTVLAYHPVRLIVFVKFNTRNKLRRFNSNDSNNSMRTAHQCMLPQPGLRISKEDMEDLVGVGGEVGVIIIFRPYIIECVIDHGLTLGGLGMPLLGGLAGGLLLVRMHIVNLRFACILMFPRFPFRET